MKTDISPSQQNNSMQSENQSLYSLRAYLVIFGFLLFHAAQSQPGHLNGIPLLFSWFAIMTLAGYAVMQPKGLGLAFAASRFQKKWAVMGMLGAILYVVMASWIISTMIQEQPTDTDVMKAFEDHPVEFMIFALLAPIWEELYYRGMIYSTVERVAGNGKTAKFISILFVSIWFGVIHGPQMNWWLPSLTVVFGAGLIFTVLRAYSGSIVPGMLAHLVYNCTILSGSLLFSETPTSSLY